MIQLHNTPNWYLDDNGITVIDKNGSQVVDLRNECEIKDVVSQDGVLQVHFEKQVDEIQPVVIPAGTLITLMLCNIERVESVPSGKTFEGIYEFDSQSLNLCIDDDSVYVQVEAINLKLVLND